MGQVFTDYVRSLGDKGEPSDPESFPRMWRSLRRALRRELLRRGLWQSSPTFLGVHGWVHWWEVDRVEPGGGIVSGVPRDALDELAVAAYLFVFVQRLGSLRRHLRLKPNLEGLVHRSLRNFLHDAQRRHDSLGYRIFGVLQRALERSLASGSLHLLHGGSRLTNTTVFGFHRAVELGDVETPDLADIVRRWNDELLSELVTARGEQEEALQQRLEELIAGLADEGVEVFTFHDLIDPLKRDLRARWAALWHQSEGDTALEAAGGEGLVEIVRRVSPGTRVEDRDLVEKLSDCVEDGLLTRPLGRRKTRDYLLTLWRFVTALLFAPDGPGHDLPSEEAVLPSSRKLAQILGIPRGRIPGLLTIVGREVDRCMEAMTGASLVKPPKGGSMPRRPGRDEMPRISVQKDLLRRTAEAWRATAAAEVETRSRGAAAPCPGEVYRLPETSEHGLEWVVLEETAEGMIVVPADSVPLAGDADLEVGSDASYGPLILRCRHQIFLSSAVLSSRYRCGALSLEDLARARERLRQVQGGPRRPSARQQRLEGDPEYLDHEEVLSASCRVLSLRGAEPSAPASAGSERSRRGLPWGLAASVLLLVTLGIAAGLGFERRESRRVQEALDRRIAALEAGLERQTREHEGERGRLLRELERTEELHREELEKLGQSLREARRSEPILVPWVELFERTVPRGQEGPRAIAVPAGTSRWIGMMLMDAPRLRAGDRLELLSRSSRRLLWHWEWAAEQEQVPLVLVPREEFSPGGFELVLRRGEAGEEMRRYRLEVNGE